VNELPRNRRAAHYAQGTSVKATLPISIPRIYMLFSQYNTYMQPFLTWLQNITEKTCSSAVIEKRRNPPGFEGRQKGEKGMKKVGKRKRKGKRKKGSKKDFKKILCIYVTFYEYLYLRIF